jgi:hypothetical protein
MPAKAIQDHLAEASQRLGELGRVIGVDHDQVVVLEVSK